MWTKVPFAALAAVLVGSLFSMGVAAAKSTTSSLSVSGLNVSKQLQSQVQKDFGAYPKVSGDTTRGINGNTITIGIMGDVTDQGNAVFPGICQGAEARFDRANKTHELKWKIDVAGCVDTGSTPSKATTAENSFVFTKKVFGMVNLSLLSAQNDDILEKNHVPYVGWGVTPGFCGKTQPFGFGDSGAGVCDAVSTQSGGKYSLVNELQVGGYLRAIKTAPKSVRLAVVGDDTAISKQSVPQETRNAKAAGVDVVYSGNTLPSSAAAATNFVPYVSPILSAKPTAVYSLATLLPELLGALKQAGYTGAIYQNTFSTAGVLATPTLGALLNGVYAVNPGLGSTVFGGPDWKTVEDDAKAIGYTARLSTGFVHSYVDADIWVQMLKAFSKTGEKLTTENLTNFVNSGWTYTGFGNVSSPISFPAGHYVGTSCASTTKFDTSTKSLVPVSDLSCAPAKIVKS